MESMPPRKRGRKESEKMGLIPKNERRVVERIEKKRILLFGAPGAGKTYLANGFPDPLLINTDGNWKFVDCAKVFISDTQDGNMQTTGWETFKRVVDELAKYEQDFKTVCVDLGEDIIEYARRDVLRRKGWEHEDDAGGYGKGYKLVADEFMPVFNKFWGLEYENMIMCCHAKVSEVTRRNGSKYTTIAPKLPGGILDKIMGKVDFVGYIHKAESDGEERIIEIDTGEENGSFTRINAFKQKVIPATYDAICQLYELKPEEMARVAPTVEPTVETATEPLTDTETPETPKRRKLKRKDDGE